MTSTLGTILKQTAAADVAAAEARVQREQAQAAAQRVEDRKETVALFASYKVRIESSILNSGRFIPIELRTADRVGRIQKLLGLYDDGKRIDAATHANHDVWLEFIAWSREQGLEVSIAYDFSDECNDAGPEDAWYEMRGVAL
jgi:hypothetical protein